MNTAHRFGPLPIGTALVLGGAGFIGSNLVRAMVAAGDRPRVMGRPSRSLANLGPVLGHVDWRPGDFMDDAVLRDALQGVDTVFHLITTTFPNLRVESSNFDLLSNLLPTIRMLELARELGVRRIVYASSGGTVYGEPQQLPITEDHPLAPKSAYGQSKLTIENYLLFYARTTDLEVSVLRMSNPYGPGQNTLGVQGLIAVAMGCLRDRRAMNVYGDGAAVRDYLYVDDAVDAMLLAAGHPPALMNVSSGVGHSVNEVLAAVERASGRSLIRAAIPARTADVRANILDNRRAAERLGWQPRIDLDEGLARTWRSLAH
jgi:UDP-glucose 4-epimerase